jgi:ATP-dependent DNA helicase RecG
VSELQFIKGIGPKRAEALASAGIECLEDLVGYYPRRYIDAREVVPLNQAMQHLWQSITVRGRVTNIQAHIQRHPKRVQITIRDQSSGFLQLVFFQGAEYWAKQFVQGDEVVVVGYMSVFNGTPQMAHPIHIEKVADAEGFTEGRMIPIYPSTGELKKARVSQPLLRQMIEKVLTLPEAKRGYQEILPEDLVRSRGLLPRPEAVLTIHHPESPEKLERARYRLKYEELFFLQLRLGLEKKRNALRAKQGIKFDTRNLDDAVSSQFGLGSDESLISILGRALPFELTNAQRRVLRELAQDMAKQDKPTPMHRLVQGDVGSGKTIVAVLSMLCAIENGYQCALMAPTEILAEQHFNTLKEQLKHLPITVTLIVGAQKKKERDLALQEIASGYAHIAIGTHALIEEGVQFDKLGFVVIDEQHRFGVAQRKALIDKAQAAERADFAPDVLIMTATPIPRTLGLTLYGDLDVSVIDELPKNRKPIVTKLLFEEDHEKIYRAIRRAIQERGEQVYIVYPLVEMSAKTDLAAATHSYERLSEEVFPDLKVGLLHGKLPPKEKQLVMHSFRDKHLDILVATTVIEVGIDVPNATVMIIEHAERFGLAQLHQLRGRVGRGGAQSHCILVASNKLKRRESYLETSQQAEERSVAMERLETMVATNDGFKIAEADLEMRGPGEFFGTKQSGLPVFQIADLVRDVAIMEIAREDALAIVERDPHLRTAENSMTRTAFLGRFQGADSFMQIG